MAKPSLESFERLQGQPAQGAPPALESFEDPGMSPLAGLEQMRRQQLVANAQPPADPAVQQTFQELQQQNQLAGLSPLEKRWGKALRKGTALLPSFLMPQIGMAAAESGLQSLANVANIIPGVNIQIPQTVPAGPQRTAGRVLGGIAGFMVPEMLAARGIEAVPALAKMPGVLSRMVTGGAIGAGEAAPGKRTKTGLETAALSPIADIASAALTPAQTLKGLGKFIKPKRSQEMAEELKQSLPPGIKLSAGKLLQSSPLIGLENILEKIPFSGAKHGATELHQYIRSHIEDFMNNLHGKDSPNLDQDAFNEIHKGYEGKLNKYEAALDDFFQHARATPGMRQVTTPGAISLDNISALHGSYKDALQKTLSKLKGRKTLPPDVQATKEVLDNYDPKNLNITGLDDFELYKKLMNQDWRTHWDAKNHTASLVITDMKHALMKDLESSAHNITPSLADKLRESDRIYSQEVMPYKELNGKPTAFYKVLKQKVPNTDKFIQNYLKPGAKQDQANILGHAINLADNPENMRQILASHHFKPSVFETTTARETNLGKFMNLFSKLGERQKELIFSDLKPQLDKFSKIRSIYPDIFNPDFIPKTGFQMAKLAVPLAEGAAAGHAALTGSLPAAAAMLAIPTLAARGVSKLLRSDVIPKIAYGAGKVKRPRALLELTRGGLLGGMLNRKRGKK